MFSSNQNIDKIYALSLDLKKYIELKGRYLQIDLVCKLTSILTFIIAGFIISVVLVFVLLFASIAFAEFINSYLFSRVASYGIITLVYLLMALLVYFNRRKWIEKPIANFLGHLFIDKHKQN